MKHRKQKLTIGILLILILSVSFQGCISTPTPSPIPPTPVSIIPMGEPTPTNCPYVTPVASQIQYKPKLIYALIDRSGSYGAYTQSAITVLVQSLILSIKPGDALYLVWLGENEEPDDYLLYGIVPPLDNPILTPAIPTFTPAPPSTEALIPTVTYTPSTMTILKAQVATEIAMTQSANETATAQALSIMATHEARAQEQDANSQRCLQVAINDFNQQKLLEQEEHKKSIIDSYIAQTLKPLLTPEVQVPDKGTHIYNNIYIASRIIQTEQAKDSYSSYHLLILSDMEDIGSNRGDELNVSLQGINIMVAMLYCKESIQCQERINYWQDYFVQRGATLPYNPFRIIQETTPESIADFFNQ